MGLPKGSEVLSYVGTQWSSRFIVWRYPRVRKYYLMGVPKFLGVFGFVGLLGFFGFLGLLGFMGLLGSLGFFGFLGVRIVVFPYILNGD